MKQLYQSPEVSIVEVKCEDFICQSGGYSLSPINEVTDSSVYDDIY